ncbi:unnamed protein product, partial [Ectocarpus sp. 13 AM-2016]
DGFVEETRLGNCFQDIFEHRRHLQIEETRQEITAAKEVHNHKKHHLCLPLVIVQPLGGDASFSSTRVPCRLVNEGRVHPVDINELDSSLPLPLSHRHSHLV